MINKEEGDIVNKGKNVKARILNDFLPAYKTVVKQGVSGLNALDIQEKVRQALWEDECSNKKDTEPSADWEPSGCAWHAFCLFGPGGELHSTQPWMLEVLNGTDE